MVLIRSSLLALIVLSLNACVGNSTPVGISREKQEISGMLEPAELSFKRRGTHRLLIEGKPMYFAESKLINLHSYEGTTVTLIGMLEINKDPEDLPVLVVTEVIESANKGKVWNLDRFNVSFVCPQDWTSAESLNDIQFFVPGSPKPVLTIFKQEEQPHDDGFRIKLDNEDAIRIQKPDSGSEAVYADIGDSFVVILFSPENTSGDYIGLRNSWLTLLKSIKFGIKKNHDIDKTVTGSLIPCGGSAGVLCPQGYFCDISDINENIGTCNKIKLAD